MTQLIYRHVCMSTYKKGALLSDYDSLLIAIKINIVVNISPHRFLLDNWRISSLGIGREKQNRAMISSGNLSWYVSEFWVRVVYIWIMLVYPIDREVNTTYDYSSKSRSAFFIFFKCILEWFVVLVYVWLNLDNLEIYTLVWAFKTLEPAIVDKQSNTNSWNV